jgi:hypothetical protein
MGSNLKTKLRTSLTIDSYFFVVRSSLKVLPSSPPCPPVPLLVPLLVVPLLVVLLMPLLKKPRKKKRKNLMM